MEAPVDSQIFISFTHKDNAKLSDEQHGWIDRFHEALQERLNQLWGSETIVWRDPKIGGNDLLTEVIVAALERSALLVSVLSPGYVKSQWCNDELRMFCEAANRSGGLHAGSKSRIIKAIKTPVADELQGPIAELRDSRGYPFFRLGDRGVAWEFDPRLGQEARQEFLCQVNELAHDLCRTLESLLGTRESRREVAAPSGVTIYVAETSFDRVADAERLRRELKQLGHTVLPDVPLNYTPDYGERVSALLKRAQLSVHQVGAGYGIIPESQERSVVALQYDLAGREAEDRPEFTRLPWMPPGVTITEDRQQSFVDSLQGDRHLLVTSLENLKTSIGDIIEGLRRTAVTKPKTPPAVRSIYLIFDPIDGDAMLPVEDWLFSQGFEVFRPLAFGDERQLREDHEENLKTCDAVLIFHGQTNEFWLRTKLRDLQKAFGYGRERPFGSRAVIIGDPATPEKQRFRSNEVLVLRTGGQFDPATLEPFIKPLGTRAKVAT
jgi:hypothetical protein